MNKKLPRLYVNKIDKVIDNNVKVFYSALKPKDDMPIKAEIKDDQKSIKEKNIWNKRRRFSFATERRKCIKYLLP